jgi:hypothetical protein
VEKRKSLEAYEQAWAETVEEKVRTWLDECWTAASTYENPLTDTVCGIDSMVRLILDYPVMFPDATMRKAGSADEHHGCVRWPWRLSSSARIRTMGRDFGHALQGVDIIDFTSDGKISRVISFFDDGGRARVAAGRA